VAFDYFGVDCEKQSLSNDNSVKGLRVALGPQTKQGPTFKRVPGPQNVYFNHCVYSKFFYNLCILFLS